jgi:branched-chain amino acid transport system substrate-binding protein
MWDGSKWVPQSGWIAAFTDVVNGVVKEQSAEFAKTGK